ncbi:MAG TPA: pirin family protein [Thermomicrobiales bacterium]|jgi:hypothetical protein|nr:pirin family protein [Thermomicrobiales bacterium]
MVTVTRADGTAVPELIDGVPGGQTPEAERVNLWPEQATPELAVPRPAGGKRVTIYRADGHHLVADQGKFVIHFHFPGYLLPEPTDHGHYGLATIAESFLAPGTWIRLHEHHDDEIISWVPRGVMRHDDQTVGKLDTDPDHLMVMNAGRSFWHEERVMDDDQPLRMLQIFVRPHSPNLEPHIQHGPIPEPVTGEWRHLFGPGPDPAACGTEITETRAAPGADGASFTVRNDVHLYDIRLDAGTVAELPSRPGWHTYFHVFEGEAQVDGERFTQAQSGLITEDVTGVPITATGPTRVVLFQIRPGAPVSNTGTVSR